MTRSIWDRGNNGSLTTGAATTFLAALLMIAIAFTARAAGPERFILHDMPKDVPSLAFADGTGQQHTLAEFRGKIVLLNVWATWCGPCRREMPALDRLQTTLGGPDFQVLALSIDRTGADAVKKFYTETGVHNLSLYVDTSGSAARQLNAIGLPVTILIGRDGRERGRLIGPAEWDTSEMIEFLRRIVVERTGYFTPHSQNSASTPDQLRADPNLADPLERATQQESRRSHA